MKALHLQQLEHASTWFLAAWLLCLRFLLAALLIALFRPRLLVEMNRREVWQGFGLAVFAAPGLLLQADGLGETEASTSAFLTQAYCILLPLWAAVAHRSWLSRRVLICTFLVVVGIGILSKLDLHRMHIGPGEWKTLLAAVFFTGQILWLERPCFASCRPLHASFVMFVCIGALSLPLALHATPSAGAFASAWGNPPALAMVAAITLGCTLFSFLMMNQWQKHVSATEAGLIYCLEPVFTAAYALFLPALLGRLAHVDYPNETITRAMLTGGILVTAANIFLQWPPPRKNPPAQSPS
jgi:drug/metabolite transporter (DMT)-like permease